MNELDRIKLLNEALSQLSLPTPHSLESKVRQSNLYIIGCPRSGTTVLLQYLASTGIWDVPSNLMARFVSSPYIGSLVQQLLLDEGSFDDEYATFSSDYGRSKGLFNTNEFFHFFRHYLGIQEIAPLSAQQMDTARIDDMFAKLREPSRLSGKPFLSKAMMLQYNLADFARQCPDDIFLYIKRSPTFTMQSIYQARLKECGSVEKWWSAKPAEYESLKKRSVCEQIAGQVFYTEKAIEGSLSILNPQQYLCVSYEDLTTAPSFVLQEVIKKYQTKGMELALPLVDPPPIHNQNHLKIETKVFDELSTAYAALEHLHKD